MQKVLSIRRAIRESQGATSNLARHLSQVLFDTSRRERMTAAAKNRLLRSCAIDALTVNDSAVLSICNTVTQVLDSLYETHALDVTGWLEHRAEHESRDFTSNHGLMLTDDSKTVLGLLKLVQDPNFMDESDIGAALTDGNGYFLYLRCYRFGFKELY
jgi:hypothetical protein